MLLPCQNDDDFHRLLQDSQAAPVFLLKHSTRCPVSAGAKTRFDKYAADHPEVECWYVLVVEQRPLSLAIAEQTGVQHQSPQAILFVEGKPVWNASHWSISESALAEAYDEHKV
ncbi:MAG: bacillithiol system redox-active protein YtxJ [Armatimonadota bacterium]